MCPIIIASRSLNSKKLDIYPDEDEINFDYYTKNPVWDIVNTTINESLNLAKSKYYNNEDFDEFFYNITIKRLPLYFMINNVYPFLILNIVTLANYFLPFASQTTLSK